MEQEIKFLGFGYTSLNVKKFPDFKGKLEAKSDINITSVEKNKLDFTDKEALKFDFKFTLDYTNFANIYFEGFLIFLVDDQLSKETLTQWKDLKQVPDKLRIIILNTILQKCSLKALQLEDDFGLPYHISFPRFQANSEKPESK
ncbi:MAG: hypothetical protein Q7S33_05380 [Nanoarchaeota archaeon]|nr:hypothetical protein [Nanoarchaeota archaeon]